MIWLKRFFIGATLAVLAVPLLLPDPDKLDATYTHDAIRFEYPGDWQVRRNPRTGGLIIAESYVPSDVTMLDLPHEILTIYILTPDLLVGESGDLLPPKSDPAFVLGYVADRIHALAAEDAPVESGEFGDLEERLISGHTAAVMNLTTDAGTLLGIAIDYRGTPVLLIANIAPDAEHDRAIVMDIAESLSLPHE